MATPSVTHTLVNGTTIDAPDLNQNFADLIAFLTNEVVHVDGTKAMTGNLDMGGTNTVANLAAPVNPNDAARKTDVESGDTHDHDAAYLAIGGEAVTATQLATARTIDITGDITATAQPFDGTANIAISAAVNNDSHTHGDSTINGLNASATTAGTFSHDRLPSTAPKIWVQASAPSATAAGQIWIDT